MIQEYLTCYNKHKSPYSIKFKQIKIFKDLEDRNFYNYILSEYQNLINKKSSMFKKGIKYKSFFNKKYS